MKTEELKKSSGNYLIRFLQKRRFDRNKKLVCSQLNVDKRPNMLGGAVKRRIECENSTSLELTEVYMPAKRPFIPHPLSRGVSFRQLHAALCYQQDIQRVSSFSLLLN